VTRDENFVVPGGEVYRSPAAALAALQDQEEVMMIGGAELIKQLMPQADRMYLTHIHDTFTVDVYFPEWHENQWQIVAKETHSADEKNPHAYTFITYERLGRVPKECLYHRQTL
jgi:dihydrofolate reductase